MTREPAILLLGPSGVETARKVHDALHGAELHGARARVDNADTTFVEFAPHVASLFAAGRPIIGICAAGILIRTLAPLLQDKKAEPPVIAVAEDGSAVVPLLGGHAGANELARSIATALGCSPAITTAGDLRFGIALDAPPNGWTLANPEHAKEVMAALLGGAKAHLAGKANWLETSALPLAADGEVEVVSTVEITNGHTSRLVYHPKRLALGVGCERDCEPQELIALVSKMLRKNNLAPEAVALVASLDLKADETAVHNLAAHLDAPARFYDAERLNAEAPRLKNPSDIVLREVGCPGVAEGAALACAGPHGTLLIEKTKSKRATCAIAVAPEIIDPSSCGRARGALSVVGIGPGSREWRSAESVTLLAQATDWVGYGLYLDLVSDLNRTAHEHHFALGEEEKRTRHALELAGEGRNVALVCSGDAGIYAMASLVYELMDTGGSGVPVSDAAQRVAVIVAPGISALQAAAARAGAPLGHDFCTISLSDLLTPWETIERRLDAAARGDFVVALYNPRSRRRTSQLEQAVEILRQHRPPETPVIVAANLGRDNERLTVVSLSEFEPEIVDMLTVVIVGSSETRKTGTATRPRVYTPRGYEAKEPRP